MRNRSPFFATALAVACLSLPQRLSANTLELALVIDGSGSISASDWQLQIGAYQNIFENDFYTNIIQPSPFDDIAVAAYIFSGDFVQVGPDLLPFVVFSFIDWTLINDDADADAFGAQFAGLQQPPFKTYTSEALNIAANGGFVGCPDPTVCNVVVPATPPYRATATGLLNNAYDGDVLVIDISTDGVPTLPNANGVVNPNDPANQAALAMDRALAIDAANAARAAGIRVNAIGVGPGVGPGVDAAFLPALVGIDPASTPTGFFLTASGFSEFDDGLAEKIGRETAVPVTPAMPLALTAFGSALFWRRKRATAA